MKIRFIEFNDPKNILCETENTEWLSAIFDKHTQIHITQEKEILVCEYVYNVLKVLENEMDIFVTIIDSDEIKEVIVEEPPIKKDVSKKIMKKELYEEVFKQFQPKTQKPKNMKILMKKNLFEDFK